MQVKKSKREDLMILKKMHRCDDCRKVFASKKSLYQHTRKKHGKKPTLSQTKFRCGHCETEFVSTRNLLRHLKNQHNLAGNYKCNCCSTIFRAQLPLNEQLRTFHSIQSNSQGTKLLNFSESVSASAIKTALKSSFTVYRLDLEKNDVESFHYLISNTNHIISFINAKLPDDGSSRIGLTIYVQLCKPLEGE